MASSNVILPKDSVFKPKELNRAIQNTLNATAKAIKVDLALPAATWDHQPKITIKETGPYERTVEVEDEVYVMLNKGTKAHDIKPKRGKLLKFNTPFRPKTVPNQLRSNKGSKGSVAVFSKGVRHPGTKARNWAKVAADKWNKQVATTFQRAIDAEFGG